MQVLVPGISAELLLDGIVAGKVTVLPDNTWFSSSVPAGVAQRFQSGGFSAAVVAALENFPALRSEAEKHSGTIDGATMEDEFCRALVQ